MVHPEKNLLQNCVTRTNPTHGDDATVHDVKGIQVKRAIGKELELVISHGGLKYRCNGGSVDKCSLVWWLITNEVKWGPDAVVNDRYHQP